MDAVYSLPTLLLPNRHVFLGLLAVAWYLGGAALMGEAAGKLATFSPETLQVRSNRAGRVLHVCLRLVARPARLVGVAAGRRLIKFSDQAARHDPDLSLLLVFALPCTPPQPPGFELIAAVAGFMQSVSDTAMERFAYVFQVRSPHPTW